MFIYLHDCCYYWLMLCLWFGIYSHCFILLYIFHTLSFLTFYQRELSVNTTFDYLFVCILQRILIGGFSCCSIYPKPVQTQPPPWTRSRRRCRRWSWRRTMPWTVRSWTSNWPRMPTFAPKRYTIYSKYWKNIMDNVGIGNGVGISLDNDKHLRSI